MPGDIVTIKVFITKVQYVESDLIKITEGSPQRHDELIKCKYFGSCSGCQYQQLHYSDQLKFKQATIQNAYKFFAPRLSQNGQLPTIGETMPSPLQYGYRSKLTPHYEPHRSADAKTLPNVGFGSKGRPQFRSDVVPLRDYPGSVMDIEDCIIGTPIIRQGMKNERAKLAANYKGSKKGATILLREDTKLIDPESETGALLDGPLKGSRDVNGELSVIKTEDGKFAKTCVTDNNATVSENVNGIRFDFVANEFFQNNNSILPSVIKYVSDNLSIDLSDPENENYLVDAYCGSGLFSLSIAKDVTKSLGVEISAKSIQFAKLNKEINKITNCDFIEGKAEKLFSKIDFPKDKTSVILDPPRKGCDEVFLKQLSEFFPRKIVYVSCNVHSQARDVEYFLNDTENGKHYEVESIRGFDFFPQTHHVEGVAVLKRKA
ncbi:unnamed protein product [Ambrosiozyma monospora]|uniref:Unnamed protein product n=1 Tax=Ambrosiozyma monospora TaxID=43982 RepID=A0A9W7DKW8_AMBMO|nr:unnamed protein product [Ambrosiozyma monospora]